MQVFLRRTALSLGLTFAALESLQGCLVADDGRSPTGNGGGSAGEPAGGGFHGSGAAPAGGSGGVRMDAGASGGVAGGGGLPFSGGGAGGVRIDAGAGGAAGAAGAGGVRPSGGAAGAAGAAGAPATDPCIGTAFPTSYGLSCGANLGSGADVRRLYLCDGTTTTSSVVCAQGCHAAPVGQDDYCVGVDTDPCMNNTFSSASGHAVWCARNLLSTLEPNTLYTCDGQTVWGTEECPNGCHVSPPGQADYCN